MAIAEPTADTTREGPLASGGGTIRPEELAAAHSSCFPVSRLFAGAGISVTATLDPAP